MLCSIILAYAFPDHTVKVYPKGGKRSKGYTNDMMRTGA